MEWLRQFLTEEPLSIAIPLVIGIFIYAVRRAHIKHLDRIKKIDETYTPF